MSGKYLYYPGCSMETSARAYQHSLTAICDTIGLDLIARKHGSGWYARPRDLFQLVRPPPIE